VFAKVAFGKTLAPHGAGRKVVPLSAMERQSFLDGQFDAPGVAAMEVGFEPKVIREGKKWVVDKLTEAGIAVVKATSAVADVPETLTRAPAHIRLAACVELYGEMDRIAVRRNPTAVDEAALKAKADEMFFLYSEGRDASFNNYMGRNIFELPLQYLDDVPPSDCSCQAGEAMNKVRKEAFRSHTTCVSSTTGAGGRDANHNANAQIMRWVHKRNSKRVRAERGKLIAIEKKKRRALHGGGR
jgi:hypothetical protein